jgi:NAD(P)-dependent dehydrogenase (short-subunit alcohol dehydrogenase family)
MTGKMEGRVAIATGAGSGMGAATAQLLHREGAKVVLADISGEQEALAKELGEGAIAVHADVSKPPMSRPWWMLP